MDKLKQWVALTVVAVIAVLAGGWFLLVSPKRHDASDINAQATAQDTTNAGLLTQLAMLKAQAKDEPAQEAKLAKVAAKIPDNPALPALIRDLDKASTLAGVDVTSLSPSTPALVTAPVSTATTPSKSAAGTAAGAAPAAPVKVGAAPVTSEAGSLAAIPVTMSVTGTYFQVLEFVDQLESLNRAFKVAGLAIAPGGGSAAPAAGASGTTASAPTTNNKVTVGVTGTVYMAAGRVPLPAVTLPKPGK